MTVQGLAARVPVAAGVWAEARAKVKVEWADHLPQGPAEIAYVRTAIIQNRTSPDNLVIKKSALNVERQ